MYEPISNGQIRFTSNHSLDDVIRYAEEWMKSEDDGRLLHLHVRSCGADEFAIVFERESDGSRKDHEKFAHRLTDKLKRRFGNDARYSITSGRWVISR